MLRRSGQTEADEISFEQENERALLQASQGESSGTCLHRTRSEPNVSFHKEKVE